MCPNSETPAKCLASWLKLYWIVFKGLWSCVFGVGFGEL
ncbi:hypothetical protein HMPREF9296_2610 [Prevotella disiens FB035-09AN]|uniref:Uncharacterized protein n=1 Tax=Prevotella disiens FB035-09AN TaxID=866771 RepID=E1KP72_9BACT|nr:hypothetical protein HMPREF9296_2610 [Prevotella disiens FB035-09AN]